MCHTNLIHCSHSAQYGKAHSIKVVSNGVIYPHSKYELEKTLGSDIQNGFQKRRWTSQQDEKKGLIAL